jgi:hypothetical protein
MRSMIVTMGSVLLALVGGCGSPSTSGTDAGAADVGSSTDGGGVDASTDAATGDVGAMNDASPSDAGGADAGSDAGTSSDAGGFDAALRPDTGAPVDAGGGARTFACGPTDACVIDNEYCNLVTGGAPPGIMSYSCIALPATCTGRGATRSCATCFPSGTPGGMCTDLGPGELQVTLFAP